MYTTDVITDNVQFLDSRKKEPMKSALTGDIPNQTLNQSTTSIKSNEVLNEDDFNQIGFDANDDDWLPF